MVRSGRIGAPGAAGLAAIVAGILGWAFVVHPAAAFPTQANAKEEFLRVAGESGRPGGRIVVALRSEAKTLNPLIAVDGTTREVISAMQADLVHINRATQLTEPALAKLCKVSSDGLRYTLTLRQGLKFSDGHAVDIANVLFTFRVYFD